MSGIISIETLLFNVRLSVRYHHRRRAFFDTLNLAAHACSVIFGSAAIAALLKSSQDLVLYASAIVTVMATLNLVLRSSERARLHHDLAKRFMTLEQKLLPAAQSEFAQLYAEKLSIEAEEPAPLQVLAVLCHNDQIGAEGIKPERRIALRWWQRLFAQLIDLPPAPLPHA